MSKVTFKHSNQSKLYPKLFLAVCQVYEDNNQDGICVAGYRDLSTQKATNAYVLVTRKGAYQTKDGAVYTGYGKDRVCWASAYGKSNHCFTIAMDMDDWFETLTNEQLKPYGLVKPMEHEPWHVTLIELVGISESKKNIIRDSVLKGVSVDMKVTDFQVMTGLQPDNKAGPITRAKARELIQVCHKILGNDLENDQKIIFDIIKRMGGK